MNLSACAGLPKTPERGTWYRAIDPKYMTSALSSAHTKRTITRFNAGTMLPPRQRFAALYFADSPLTASYEIKALLGSPFITGGSIPHPRHSSYVMLTVTIDLRDVRDLTDVAAGQVPLDTNPQELTGDWLGYQYRNAMTAIPAPSGRAPTQELGRELYKTGAEGFKAISAPVPNQRTLIVFPDNLKSGSSLSIFDSAGKEIYRLP